jgi:replicative DNA helicase
LEAEIKKRKSDVDLFAEKRLLQTLYFQTDFLDHPQINEDIFSSLATKNVYKSIVYLKDNNISFSRDALLQEYSKIDLDANSAIIDVITQPQNQPLQTINDIIIQLKDAKKRREASAKLKKAAHEIDSLSTLQNSQDINIIKDLINDGESELNTEDHNIKKVMKFDEWFDDYEKELKNRKKGKQYWFHNFIFDELVLDGPRPGEIGIISAASGTGKSSTVLCLINDLISNNPPVPCMYFSPEMSGITTMDRLLCRRLGIKYHDIASPQKDSPEFEVILQMYENEKTVLTQNKLFRFSEDANLTLSELRKHIKKFQADIGFTYCIVVIDLLSMVTDFTRVKSGTNFAQSIEIGINTLSAMAKELNVHFIGVLQLNRTSEADAGRIHDKKDLQKFKPNRAQIKNAGAWVERARYVLTTFREKYYAEQYLPKEDWENDLDIIEVSTVKINNGQCKKINGLFNGEFFSIDPLPQTVQSIDDVN